jgi:hypothetical protein
MTLKLNMIEVIDFVTMSIVIFVAIRLLVLKMLSIICHNLPSVVEVECGALCDPDV